MRGFSTMSDDERNRIKQLHSTPYNGYAVGNVPTNITPLTVYDPAQDKLGITVTSNGDVKTYQNHRINEIAAKNLHYDEIEPAYEFDSGGPGDPNLGYNVYNQTKKPYNFDSQGPADPFYGGGYQTGFEEHGEGSDDDFKFDMVGFEEDIKGEDFGNIEESVNKTIDMFKRFKNYN
jgi:hypothetical protein